MSPDPAMTNITEVEAVPVIDVQIEQALATFDPVAAGLDELRTKATGLQIAGIDDDEGFALVRSIRLELKSVRVAVEKRRKELKADSLKFGRAVDARAAEIIEPIRELEEPLHEQEKLIDEQRAERKAAEERAAKAILDERVAMLQAVGASVPVSTIAEWSDEEYESMLAEYGARWAKEQEAKAEREAQEAKERAEAEAAAEAARKAEEAERDAEAARMAEERKALEAERAAAQAERNKLDAERRELDEAKRIEAAKAAAVQEERDRAEREKRAAELKAQREAELAAKREAEAAALKARQDAARSDAEKVRLIANSLPLPSGHALSSDTVAGQVADIIRRCDAALSALADSLDGGAA